MNKSQLIEEVAKNAEITNDQSKKLINAITKTITNELENKRDVMLVGFGKFSTVERSARKGRNPRTGETIQISEKTVVKFKPGKRLSSSVNI